MACNLNNTSIKNLTSIYADFNRGGAGFVRAVATHCGYDMSDDEIARVADSAATADEFETIQKNDDWWIDANN